MGVSHVSVRFWGNWNDWSLGAKGLVAVATPLALLLVALWFSYRLQQDSIAADADVRRALAIQAEIQTLHSHIAESATSVRGYLLTGREDFLTPYTAAREALPLTLSRLRSSIRDPEMRDRLEHIQHLLNRKLLSLDALRDEGRQLSPADLQAHLLGSKGLLDKLRSEIRAMDAREAALVAQYSEAAGVALRRNLWIGAIISALVLATGLAAFLLLFRGVIWRVKRLAMNAERLVSGQTLEALPAGQDELGQLAQRLQNASMLLAARAAEAKSASEAKTQFLSRTSHELRTPLNAILGFAQILEMDLRQTNHESHVAQIVEAGRHLLNLIDEVLDISSIESGSVKLSLEPLHLASVASELRDLISPLASQRKVSVHLGTELGGLAVMADRRRLRQILLNLLSNAVKYNRVGGTVHIGTRTNGDKILLTVSDTGPGIPAEQMSRLFTPFDRLDADQGHVPGTGLGLAVSKQLARRMDGDIEARSELGVGSEFSLCLPAATTAMQTIAVDDSSMAVRQAREAQAGERRLLVIEDHPSNLAFIQALVARRPEWRLEVARDGVLGVDLAKKLKPDLVLLDLHLPGQNGESVLAALRSDLSLNATPIVIISAEALPETLNRLKAAGATDYLTKPLSVPRLLALLDRNQP